MLLPVHDILVGSAGGNLGLGHDRGDDVPDREYDVVAEAWLLLSHNCCISVAKEARAHMIGFFNISLHKELIEQQVRPFPERLKLACWC